MRSIVYAPRALRDVDDILSFIHARSPAGARNVSLAIEHAIQACAFNPGIGTRTDEPNVYRRPLGRYRDTIFYRHNPEGSSIEVLRVDHGQRVKSLHRLPQDD